MISKRICFVLVCVLGVLHQMRQSEGIQISFDKSGCMKFRKLLAEHTRKAKKYSGVSERIGIASVGLFFVPILPYPLGISAILLSEQGESREKKGLKGMGVSRRNWEIINCKCAQLLTNEEGREVNALTEMRFDGKNRTSIVLGAMALAYASLIHVGLLFWCCFEFGSADVELEYNKSNYRRRC